MTESLEWMVLPHGPMEVLSERVRRVEGALPGMPLKRVMTVATMADGGLVLHNPMALDEAGMRGLEALGPVRFLVVPNGYHRIDAPRFAARYPDAKLLCPPAAVEKVGKVARVDGTYRDFPSDPHVSLSLLDGLAEREGLMTVKDAAGTTIVLNDAVFNMPHVDGFTSFVLRRLVGSTGGPRVSRITRLFLVRDKRAFAVALERLAAIPDLARVIVSHHEVIDREPARVLRDLAATL